MGVRAGQAPDHRARDCLRGALEHGSLYNTASASAAFLREPQSISSMATVPSRKQAMIARPV
jgi:hypothetical protein